jgi:NhaB family Na+:H+ antiporter
MAPVSGLAWPAGIITCIGVELAAISSYGTKMPAHTREVLTEYLENEYKSMHEPEYAELIVQAVAAILLVVALIFHLTEVGFVGLTIAVLVTTCNGETDEHDVRLDHLVKRLPSNY